MRAKITVNRKTTRNIFKHFLKSLQNDPEGPTYSGPVVFNLFGGAEPQ